MGNYIGYKAKNGVIHGDRIGTNGSAVALMKLFAVAYATTELPSARRARASTRPMQGAQKGNPGVDIPYVVTTAEDAKLLLRLNGKLGGDICFWADFDVTRAGAGWFMRSRPKCSKPDPSATAFNISQEMAEQLVGKPVTAGIDGPRVGTVLSTELQEDARRVIAHVQIGEVKMNAVVLQGATLNKKEPNA